MKNLSIGVSHQKKTNPELYMDVHEFPLDNGKALLRLPVPLTEGDREKLHALIELAWQSQACNLRDRPAQLEEDFKIRMTRAQYAEEWESIYHSWTLEGKSEEIATNYANQSLENVEIID